MLLVADNLHIINQTVARGLRRLDADPIVDLVTRCVSAGAQAIDINSGPLSKEPAKVFAFLVDVVQGATDLPIILDTTNPVAMEAGLRRCNRRAIINGFSLEPHKLEAILPLAAEYDADIIGYLLGPRSEVPVTLEEMMAMAVDMFAAFRTTGMDPGRLIIDPVIAPLSWDNGAVHNRAVLEVIRLLPDLLGAPVKTIAGISNLASGPMTIERKILLEQAFLPMLAAAGLDYALLNVFHSPTVQTARRCDALLHDNVFAG